MARRSKATAEKRRKEMKRKEKQHAKAERRSQRNIEKTTTDATPIEFGDASLMLVPNGEDQGVSQ